VSKPLTGHTLSRSSFHGARSTSRPTLEQPAPTKQQEMKRSQSMPQKKPRVNKMDNSDTDIKVISRSASDDTVLRNSDVDQEDTDDQVMQKKYAVLRQRVYSRELFNPPTEKTVRKPKSRPGVAAPIPRTRSYSVKVVQETKQNQDYGQKQEYAISRTPSKNKSVIQPREHEYAVSKPIVDVRGSPTIEKQTKSPVVSIPAAESHQPNVIVNLYANGDIDTTSIRPRLESAVRQVLSSDNAQSVLRPILAEASIQTGRREWAVDHATSTSTLAQQQERFKSGNQQQSLSSVSPRSKNSPLTGPPRSIVAQQQGSGRFLEDKLIKKISASRVSTQNSQKILDELVGPSMTPPMKNQTANSRTVTNSGKPPLGGSHLRDKLSHISADIGQAWEARERLKQENLLLKKKIGALSLRLDHANTNFKPASAWTTV
jgi:hypothetical protein